MRRKEKRGKNTIFGERKINENVFLGYYFVDKIIEFFFVFFREETLVKNKKQGETRETELKCRLTF